MATNGPSSQLIRQYLQQSSLSSNVQPHLSTFEKYIIGKIVALQLDYELPKEEDVKKLTPFTSEDNDYRLRHIIDLQMVHFRLSVEFTLRLPGFRILSEEDQKTLLKNAKSRVMVLRIARKYDLQTDATALAENKQLYSREYLRTFMGDFTDHLFNFCQYMSHLGVNDAEYGLMKMIVVYSLCPSLRKPSEISKIQYYYTDNLKTYVHGHRKDGGNFFDKLLFALDKVVCLGDDYENIRIPTHLDEEYNPSTILQRFNTFCAEGRIYHQMRFTERNYSPWSISPNLPFPLEF